MFILQKNALDSQSPPRSAGRPARDETWRATSCNSMSFRGNLCVVDLNVFVFFLSTKTLLICMSTDLHWFVAHAYTLYACPADSQSRSLGIVSMKLLTMKYMKGSHSRTKRSSSSNCPTSIEDKTLGDLHSTVLSHQWIIRAWLKQCYWLHYTSKRGEERNRNTTAVNIDVLNCIDQCV